MDTQTLITALMLYAGVSTNAPTADQVDSSESKQISCLAANIYHEARGQNIIGQVAVALVTLNRVKSERFPDTICKVVHQAKYYTKQNGIRVPKKHMCQFSWYCDGKPDTIANKKVYNKIQAVAYYVYALHDYLLDITKGALYYHSTKVSPRWKYKLKQTTQIGDHIFYAGI